MSRPKHKLSLRSKKVYNTLHEDIQAIIDEALYKCDVDFTLTEGYRTYEKQFEYYKKGRELDHTTGKWKVVNRKHVITNADGKIIKGNHNYYPSRAVDLMAYVPAKPQLKWDEKHLSFIASSFITISYFLYDNGIISHKLRWGGNWDKDGDLSDNNLYDLPHLEIYKP